VSRQNIDIDNIIESTRVQGATYGQSQAKRRDTTDDTKMLEVLCAVPYIHDHIALKVVGVHVHAVRHGLIERLDRLRRQVPARTAGETHTDTGRTCFSQALAEEGTWASYKCHYSW
jgi:hypothetical protein